MDKVVVIAGPTASGKTDIGIELALKLNGEIISADSMQIYRGMDIGTAKPTVEERRGIRHYMIDIVNPDEDYSVAQFKDDAMECIKTILSKNKTPIVVGGTGLYINSLVYNITFTDTITDWDYREKLNKIALEKGTHALHSYLKKIDPKSAEEIHPNNVKRVIRRWRYTSSPENPFQNRRRNHERYLLHMIIGYLALRLTERLFTGELMQELIKC